MPWCSQVNRIIFSLRPLCSSRLRQQEKSLVDQPPLDQDLLKLVLGWTTSCKDIRLTLLNWCSLVSKFTRCLISSVLSRVKVARCTWVNSSSRNFSSSWICETMSTLLKKMNEERVDSMFSSNTEGVGSTTSWMYWTRYVWWILDISSGLPMGRTWRKSAGLVANSILFCWLFAIKDQCKKVRFRNRPTIKVCVGCFWSSLDLCP